MLLCLALCTPRLCATAAGTAPRENYYLWKSGEVYRFDYKKTIGVKQEGESGKQEERLTKIEGVLVLEIRSVSPAGVTAMLRLDSPRVTLPEEALFTAQADVPQAQPERNKKIAQALAGVLKAARWNVVLFANGLVYVESRVPPKLEDWLKEIELAGAWRQKFLRILPNLIEQDLGLKVPSHERDLLLYLGSAPAAAAGHPADSLRPRREALVLASQSQEKTVVTFKRAAPKNSTPYKPPEFQAYEKATVNLVSVSNNEDGRAVFDNHLGMLDSLSEDYTAALSYTMAPALTLNQEVRVKYSLKRLAPPVD